MKKLKYFNKKNIRKTQIFKKILIKINFRANYKKKIRNYRIISIKLNNKMILYKI